MGGVLPFPFAKGEDCMGYLRSWLPQMRELAREARLREGQVSERFP